jgi:hypothetical protein
MMTAFCLWKWTSFLLAKRDLYDFLLTWRILLDELSGVDQTLNPQGYYCPFFFWKVNRPLILKFEIELELRGSKILCRKER